MELLEGIYTRRSVRSYAEGPVEREKLMEIIRAGTWAPSGLNNQPWRFVVLTDGDMRRRLAGLTRYHRIIENAPACIAVFIDKKVMYHKIKDYQAVGACVQNMLLAAHAMGLGAVWLGEILKNARKVLKLLGLGKNLELMAVVAVGRPADGQRTSTRKGLSEVLIKEF